MSTIRGLGCFVSFVCAAGLWAQDPVLRLERVGPTEGDTWNGRTTLAFRVTLLHPAMRKGGADADFVLDPPGGWRGAIRLLVTDAAGKPVDWPFENMGKNLDRPLELHRLGTASASFLLEPAKGGAAPPLGRYQVRARLATSVGKWRGSVDSAPVAVERVGPAQPKLQVIGMDGGPLMRGWPILIGVKITAPDGADGGLLLPAVEKDWQGAIELALSDRAGKPVTLPLERLGVANLQQSDLKARESRTVWFRVTADATRSLGEGPYRWAARFSLSADQSRLSHRWSGSVSALSAPVACVAPPVPLPAELARRHTWAEVEDALTEAGLLQARAEGGYMNDRTAAAQQAAGSLHRAEHLALQWLDAHPDDADGALLVANVMAAQEDKQQAIAYTYRAIAADQRQRPDGDAAAIASSRALRSLVRGFEAMPDERHAVLTPALRTALKEARAGKLPPPPITALPPAATISPAASVPTPSVPAPAAAMAPVVPAVSLPLVGPAGPARTGEPSPGAVVPLAELADAKNIADPAGQWAATARAGSQYGQTQYAAAQATGAPNIPLGMAGNSSDAWCPARKTEGTDWLEVSFAQPVPATEVRVRQNNGPGAIVKIEAIESDGTVHGWWQGVDPFVAPRIREIAWFAVRVPKTAYPVAKVKITLNLAAGPDWKQIDAVQLVAATDR